MQKQMVKMRMKKKQKMIQKWLVMRAVVTKNQQEQGQMMTMTRMMAGVTVTQTMMLTQIDGRLQQLVFFCSGLYVCAAVAAAAAAGGPSRISATDLCCSGHHAYGAVGRQELQNALDLPSGVICRRVIVTC
jgi:hypothetical protein